MRKAVTLGVATFLLLFVDWLTFHDWREPHTVRDYLTLCASLFVFACLGLARTIREGADFRPCAFDRTGNDAMGGV